MPVPIIGEHHDYLHDLPGASLAISLARYADVGRVSATLFRRRRFASTALTVSISLSIGLSRYRRG